jgi:hypothetical protein
VGLWILQLNHRGFIILSVTTHLLCLCLLLLPFVRERTVRRYYGDARQVSSARVSALALWMRPRAESERGPARCGCDDHQPEYCPKGQCLAPHRFR